MNKSQNILQSKPHLVANILEKAYSHHEEQQSECFLKTTLENEFKNCCTNSNQQEAFEFNYEFYFNSDGVINAIYFVWISPFHNVEPLNSGRFIYNENLERSEKVFELVLKVNTLHDSWARAKTNNEVSIIQFLKSENFPVPYLYDYELTSENILGFEYILMEKVKGVPLRQLCTRMDVDERGYWIEEIGKYMQEIYKLNIVVDSISFDCSANESDRSEYIVKEVTNSDEKKLWFGASLQSLERRGDFIHVRVGPYVDSKRGPFESIVDYWKSLVEFRYPIFEQLENGRFSKYVPLMQQYVEKYFSGTSALREECNKSPCKLYLCHGDLSTSNVIVCPETRKIKAVIDFEWAKLSVIEEDIRNIYEDWCIELNSLESYFKKVMEHCISPFHKEVLFHFEFIDLLSCIENYRQFHSPDQQVEAHEFIEMITNELDELLEERLK